MIKPPCYADLVRLISWDGSRMLPFQLQNKRPVGLPAGRFLYGSFAALTQIAGRHFQKMAISGVTAGRHDQKVHIS